MSAKRVIKGRATKGRGFVRDQNRKRKPKEEHIAPAPTRADTIKPNLKYGIYSDALLEGETDIWEGLDLASLDDEIKMARMRLRRALNAEAEQEKKLSSRKGRPSPDTIMKEVAHITRIETGFTPEGAFRKIERSVKNYGHDVDMVLSQLRQLINLRQQVLVVSMQEQDGEQRKQAMTQAAEMLKGMFRVATAEEEKP